MRGIDHKPGCNSSGTARAVRWFAAIHRAARAAPLKSLFSLARLIIFGPTYYRRQMRHSKSLLFVLIVCCFGANSRIGHCQSILAAADEQNKGIIERIVSDLSYCGRSMYNCHCIVSISGEISRKGSKEASEVKIQYFGRIEDSNAAYFRTDATQADSSIIYDVATPVGSFSGLSRDGKTALTDSQPFGRSSNPIDFFCKIGPFHIEQLLVDLPSHFCESQIVTKKEVNKQEVVRIEAVLRSKKSGDKFDCEFEFQDVGKFVLSSISFEAKNAKFRGKLEYDPRNPNPIPKSAIVESELSSSHVRKSVKVNSFEYGPSDLSRFMREDVGIIVSKPRSLRLYGIALLLAGVGAILLLQRWQKNNSWKDRPKSTTTDFIR